MDLRECRHGEVGALLDPSVCSVCCYESERRSAEVRIRMETGARMVERARVESRPQHLTASADGRRIIEVRCDANGHPVAMIVVLP